MELIRYAKERNVRPSPELTSVVAQLARRGGKIVDADGWIWNWKELAVDTRQYPSVFYPGESMGYNGSVSIYRFPLPRR